MSNSPSIIEAMILLSPTRCVSSKEVCQSVMPGSESYILQTLLKSLGISQNPRSWMPTIKLFFRHEKGTTELSGSILVSSLSSTGVDLFFDLTDMTIQKVHSQLGLLTNSFGLKTTTLLICSMGKSGRLSGSIRK